MREQQEKNERLETETTNPLLPPNEFNKRYASNEKFFASLIDLIPPSVYLNQDDRVNWLKMIRMSSNKPKSNERPQTKKEEEKESSEDESRQNDDDDPIKRSKFDPKYFKTVSRILKDFADLKPLNGIRLLMFLL